MLLRDTGNPPCAELSINLFNIYFLLSSGSNLLALYCEGFFKYTKNERFENICWRAEGYKYYIICIPFFLVFCFFPWSFLFGIWGVFKSIWDFLGLVLNLDCKYNNYICYKVWGNRAKMMTPVQPILTRFCWGSWKKLLKDRTPCLQPLRMLLIKLSKLSSNQKTW